MAKGTLALLSVCGLLPLLSQTYTASIRGVVTDPTQAAIGAAEVVATDVDRNIRQTATTDGAGRYVLTNLPPGRYTLTVEARGFRKYSREVFEVQVNQDITINVGLQVGEITDSITVTGEAPLLESTSSSVGKVVENREIVNLPLNTRNPYALVFLTPGVSGSVSINYDDMRYSVNGARVRMLDTMVDGVAASHPTVNGAGGVSVFPSVESIAEFKVMGANPPAEFGRSQGSILNVVYRSGANDLHFSAIEFLRNSEFDANNFFSNRNGVPLTSFRRNQFGGDISGPIRKDKTFFLFDYAGLRERNASTTTFTVPTPLERAGDFTNTLAANGQRILIYNPFTTRQSGSGYVRDPFPGNVIPVQMHDPVAVNIMKYFPDANTPGNPVTHANNFYKTGANALNVDQFDIRLDHNFSSSRRMFGRYSNRTNENAPAQFFPDQIAVAQGRVITENHMHNAVLDYSQTFTPTVILNVRAGFARTLFVYNNQGLGFAPSQLGLPRSIDMAADRLMFPAINPGSGFRSLGGNDHRRSGFNTGTLLGSISQIKGGHTIKYGFEGRLVRVNVWEARDSASFSFSQSFTQGPNPTVASATAGNGLASMLLGAGSSGNLYQSWKNVAAQSIYYAGYFQDDWRISRKLTLNLGLRYDYDTPRTERYNRFNWFDPYVASPLASKFPGLTGGLQFVGVDGHPRYQYIPDRNNWGPRLGLAYQVTQKTVIRMGYGHLFGLSPQEAIGTVGPYGFRVENTWQTSGDGGLTPLNLLRNPYPSGFQPPPGASAGLLTGVGGPIQAPYQDTVTPWSMQWNFTIQQELPGALMLETAYVGTRGLQLSRGGEGTSFNQMPLDQMSLGNRLLDTVANPFYVAGGPGFFGTRTVARNQLLRPYPQFTNVEPIFSSGSSSTYHALQVTLKKRLTMGLQFEGSYTWSKSIDSGEGGFADVYRIKLNRSITDLDVPHRFIINYVYELPFGRNRRFGKDLPRLLDTLVGGWMIDGITNYQSGGAFGISANNVCRCFNNGSYANSKGYSARLEGRPQDRLARWFDTKAFSQPDPFTIGTMGPRSSDLRNDTVANWDLGLSKDFHPVERLRVQFRADALNAWNHPRFSGPNTSVTSSSFGIVSGQSNAPRQIQFGLKVLW
ncbi:MAG: TonB-dependent receptor domain-containing protein [Bryobacteraceae bacterium]